jgi:hypothetical protein
VIWRDETAYLLFAYDKKDQADISQKQANAIATAIEEIEDGED